MIIQPSYSYYFTVQAIYDGDTVVGELDKGFNEFERDKELRLYGYNTQEIRRSKSRNIGDREVNVGFDQTEFLIHLLDNDPRNYPRKTKLHKLEKPRRVVIQTIKDNDGKYGRLLAIMHYKGENLNELMRDVVGGVQFYDGKTYPKNFPIRPPST